VTGNYAARTAVVSYGHSDPDWNPEQTESRRRHVIELVTGLRQHGVDADADAFHMNEDWTRWGPRKVSDSDLVLIVASQAWRAAWIGSGNELTNRGLRAEADAVRSIENMGRTEFQRRCRIILLPGSSEADIPVGMEGLSRHRVEAFDAASLEPLLRDLTDQPTRELPPLGPVPHLPPSSTAPAPASARTDTHGQPSPAANDGLWRTAPPVDLNRSDTWGYRMPGSPVTLVHLVPAPQAAFSQRSLSGIEAVAAGAMRPLLTPHAEIRPTAKDDVVTIEAAPERLPHGAIARSELLGCRIARTGQVSLWFTLPRDGMGAVLDRDDLTSSLTGALKVGAAVLDALGTAREQQVVIAAELADTTLLTDGKLADLGRRNSARMRGFVGQPIMLSPDESVALAALSDSTVGRVAGTVAQVLTDEWRR
jgi:hypothetical protein